MKLETKSFGTTPTGIAVREHVLAGTGGLTVSLVSYGATVRSVRMPDRNGAVDEITLGFDTLEGYLGVHPYFGSTVGRVANRIAGARFSLEGKTYTLARNDGPNHLHGGTVGFNRVVWRDEPFTEPDAVGVKFSYTSNDGEEGYPGTLEVAVTYRLSADNALTIEYEAVTDKTTPVILTNHTSGISTVRLRNRDEPFTPVFMHRGSSRWAGSHSDRSDRTGGRHAARFQGSQTDREGFFGSRRRIRSLFRD